MFAKALIFLLCLGVVRGGVLVPDETDELDFGEEDLFDEEELKFESFTGDDKEIGRQVWDYIQENWNIGGQTNLKNFEWGNCGGKGEDVVSMSVGPDPLKKGTITIAVDAVVNTTFASPLQTNLKIQYEVPIIKKWVTIPCIANFGSCNYTDICEILAGITSCPEPLVKNNIPCQCPYVARTYQLPASGFDLPIEPPEGNYHAHAEVYQNSVKLACLDIQLTFG